MIRLVATDLDGTFWRADKVVPEPHVEAVRELEARGVTVLAATSRRPRVVRAHLGAAGLALPAVVVDGAIGVDLRTGRRFHEAVFEPAVAAATLAAFRAAGLDPCVYVEHPEVDIVVSDASATCAAHLASIADVTLVGDLDAVATAELVYSFAVLGLARERLVRAAAALVDHGVRVVLYAEPEYGEHGLIVTPPGISKWSGVEAWCRLAGIGAAEVLAVGDGDNDVEMLHHAGVGVAVRGGTRAALDVADHVIDPPHDHGWATLLELVDGG